MARNRFQSWLLRTRIKCDILFDPQKLDTDPEYDEPKESVDLRFSNLPESQRSAYRAQFARHQPLPFFPLHVYKLSNPDKEEGARKRGFHWEYDRPERRMEMKKLALAGFDLTRLGGAYYKFTQLRELRKAQELGLDVEPLLDNRYNRYQLMVLTKIMRDGNDISEFANPYLPANQMADAYVDQMEDRTVDQLYQERLDHLLDAAGEIDPQFIGKEVDLTPLEDRLKDVNERAKFQIEHDDRKVVNFPVSVRNHGQEL